MSKKEDGEEFHLEDIFESTKPTEPLDEDEIISEDSYVPEDIFEKIQGWLKNSQGRNSNPSSIDEKFISSLKEKEEEIFKNYLRHDIYSKLSLTQKIIAIAEVLVSIRK